MAAFVAFCCAMAAAALGSFIAYHFVKLSYYHEQKIRRDCYYYGGIWDDRVHDCHSLTQRVG